MKILISGINGYIGSALCNQLQKDGHSVYGIVRQKNSVSEKLNVDLFECDIRNPLKFTVDTKFDFFIHLAAANDVDSNNLKLAYEVTTLGTKQCLEFCRENSIGNFIYFSTFQVYGELDKTFSDESPKSPLNEYGITHLFAEEYVKLYHRKFNLNYLILRPTNIFGAPLYKEIDRWSLVPGCFCKEAIEKGSITLLSSGKQVRNFVDLEDLCALSSKLISDFETVKNTELNAASSHIYSIIEIAKLVQEIGTNKLKKNVILELKSDLPKVANQFKIDITKIEKLNFSFRSKESIHNAIEQTFELLLK